MMMTKRFRMIVAVVLTAFPWCLQAMTVNRLPYEMTFDSYAVYVFCYNNQGYHHLSGHKKPPSSGGYSIKKATCKDSLQVAALSLFKDIIKIMM